LDFGISISEFFAGREAVGAGRFFEHDFEDLADKQDTSTFRLNQNSQN